MILLTVKWNGENHVLSNLSSTASKCIGAVFLFFPKNLIICFYLLCTDKKKKKKEGKTFNYSMKNNYNNEL